MSRACEAAVLVYLESYGRFTSFKKKMKNIVAMIKDAEVTDWRGAWSQAGFQEI